MTTLSQALEEIIKQSPFLEDALAGGIINLSALARKLKPQIEKRLYKKPTDAALIMSLKRVSTSVRKMPRGIEELREARNLTVRSSLIEYVFYNSANIISLQKQLMQKVESEKDLFVNLSQGISETTLLVSKSLQNKVESIVPKQTLIKKIDNLSSITLRLREEHVLVPGVYYSLLKALAWNNINIIEAISGYSEISIIVEQKESDRAFSCIQSLISK